MLKELGLFVIEKQKLKVDMIYFCALWKGKYQKEKSFWSLKGRTNLKANKYKQDMSKVTLWV